MDAVPSLSAVLSASTLEPIAWFLSTAPIFIFTLQQEPASRWWLLPFNVIPAWQSYKTANQLSDTLPGLDWLLAFTSLIYIIHATSALYIEKWTLARTPASSKSSKMMYLLSDPASLKTAFRAWMNPRRLRLTQDIERTSELAKIIVSRDSRVAYYSTNTNSLAKQRVLFLAKHAAQLALIGLVYVGVEIGILLALYPGPRDFGPIHQTYFPRPSGNKPAQIQSPSDGLQLSFGAPPSDVFSRRVVTLRSVYALHWAWLTFVILTAAHSTLAAIFVCVLRIDEPKEWPPLFGSPMTAFTVRRFWGRFWHQLGTPSLLSYGRIITRKMLKLSENGRLEKAALAFWVFGASGLIHALVISKTEQAGSSRGVVDAKQSSSEPLWSDMTFLMLNFAVGILETLASTVVNDRDKSDAPKGSLVQDKLQERKRRAFKMVVYAAGFLWVFAFFWCIVPPYQYPVLQKAALQRLPFQVKMSPAEAAL